MSLKCFESLAFACVLSCAYFSLEVVVTPLRICRLAYPTSWPSARTMTSLGGTPPRDLFRLLLELHINNMYEDGTIISRAKGAGELVPNGSDGHVSKISVFSMYAP